MNKNIGTLKNEGICSSAMRQAGGEKANGWILTDDASYQHVKATADPMAFDLIELSPISPDTDKCEVYKDTVCVQEYLDGDGSGDGKGGNDQKGGNSHKGLDELIPIISSFGYKSVDGVKEQYGAGAMQVLAECIFEYYGNHSARVIFTGSEAECRGYIDDYVTKY